MTGPLVIYCDASVAYIEGRWRAGWGAVLVRDGRAFKEYHAPLADGTTSTLAEFLAARLSLDAAIDDRILRKGEAVIIASDCNSVERFVMVKELFGRTECERAALGIRKRAAKHGLDLVVVKVQGHASNASGCPHARHNKRADRLAGVASGTRLSEADRVRKQREDNARNKAEAQQRSREAKAAARAKRTVRAVSDVSTRFERQLATILRLQGEP